MAEVKISLNQFEGPLGLLLFLIKKEEMDVFDINIVQITNQYLAYVKTMKTLDLEGAGDFITMAATLIHIKSRMLMPLKLLEEEEEKIDDPRKELVGKLLEYQKYQEISKQIYERPLLGRDVWTKAFKETALKRPDDIIKINDNPVYTLIFHYKKALNKANKIVHKISTKIQSISSRILEIRNILIKQSKTSLKELWIIPSNFTDNDKSRLLITFLSILELSKIGYTSLFQSQNYADIHINMKKKLPNNLGKTWLQKKDYADLNSTLFLNNKIEFDTKEIFTDHEIKNTTDDDIDNGETKLSLSLNRGL